MTIFQKFLICRKKENMVFFPWKEEYEIGIREVDEQHRELFSLINELYETMKEGKGRETVHRVLEGFIERVQLHFQAEEKWMEKYGYPGLLTHRAQHENLTKKVMEMEKNFMDAPPGFSIKLANFLREWLHNHILGSDRRFGEYLDEDRNRADKHRSR